METSVFNKLGEELEKLKLSSKIFGIKPKPEVIHFVANAMLSNLRQPLAHTKVRGDVRGGGIKPWRQKGTGRARAGSIRSPLWRGGGITFGPRKEKNYKKKINKKIKRLALKMVLTDKANHQKIVILDKLEAEKIKTKEMGKIFAKMPSKKEKTLIILDKKNKKLELSLKNIYFLTLTLANDLNLLDILKNKYLLITKEGIKQIEKIYK